MRSYIARSKWLLLVILSAILLLFSLTSSACGLMNENSGYDTDIVEKLQKEVPFTIVIPTYFPDGIPPYPTGISGPSEGKTSESVGIGFSFYDDKDNRRFIFIGEENYTITHISSDPTSIYLDIGGVQVLEEDINTYVLSDPDDPESTPELIQGALYRWNRDGVSFLVAIYGYDRDECRKVVESMIKPVE